MTSHIKGDLHHGDHFVREVEVVVTAESLLSVRQATSLLSSLYPHFTIADVTVAEL